MDGKPIVERLVDPEFADTPEMRADPALPVYVAIMARIERLIPSDPAVGTTEGDELNALVDAAVVYERRWFPELSRVGSMRELRTEPVILRDDSHPKSRLRVTWEKAPGFVGRFFGLRTFECSAIYEGAHSNWYPYEGKPTLYSKPRPVGRQLARLLASIEKRLLTSDSRD